MIQAVAKVVERGLTRRMEGFCLFMASLGSESFGNGTSSALKAGYSTKSAATQASGLMQKPKIKARMQEIYSQQVENAGITRPKVLADIEHTRQRALAKGDLATATRCSELEGKTMAMFADVNVDLPGARELSEAMRLEARRLSDVMMEQHLLVEGEVVDDGRKGLGGGGQTGFGSEAAPDGDLADNSGLPESAEPEQQSEDAQGGYAGEQRDTGEQQGNAENAEAEGVRPPKGAGPGHSITHPDKNLTLRTHSDWCI